MTIYKTVIIEDNPDNASVLRKIISENHPDIEIVAEANSVASAIEALVTFRPDIAFMDIELTPGTSFDVLAELNKTEDLGFEIIFITAHQRYDFATKAIDFSALAFISKPIDPEILRGAIEKAKEKQTRKIQLDQLLTKLQAQNEKDAQIIIPTTNNHRTAVHIAHITYFKADGQTTVVHFQDKSTLIAFRILGHFKKMLKDEHAFFLIHNSYLVNVNQIKSFKYTELEITLKNGEKIHASRRFGRDFQQYWNEFNKQKGGFLNALKGLFRKV